MIFTETIEITPTCIIKNPTDIQELIYLNEKYENRIIKGIKLSYDGIIEEVNPITFQRSSQVTINPESQLSITVSFEERNNSKN